MTNKEQAEQYIKEAATLLIKKEVNSPQFIALKEKIRGCSLLLTPEDRQEIIESLFQVLERKN